MQLKLNKGPLDMEDKQSKILLLKLLLKISVYPMLSRPFNPKKPWAVAVASQGVMNAKGPADLAGKMYDYMNDVQLPLVSVLLRALPCIQPLSDQFRINMQVWKETSEAKKETN